MVNKTLPGVVSRDGIVFASYINTRGGKSLYSYLDEEHAYSFPIDFFNDNKDKVYSNGVSIIYR